MPQTEPAALRKEPAQGPAQLRHIVLVGLPGAGKTTIGRAIAKRLSRPFVDMDDRIEQMFGTPVAKIFADAGEGAFRGAEVEVSAQLAAEPAPLVIAPGGGWVVNEPATAHLRDAARIIYLRVSPDEAVHRMGRGVLRRPLLASGDAVSALRDLQERRREAYEELAELTVETSGLPRAEVVARVLKLVDAAERDYDNEG